MNDKRKSLKYKEWRNRVKHRDGNACRKCGFEKNLEVHHIKPLKKYPQFALVLDNGITLCGNCHSLLKGKEETENLRVFLRNDLKIDQQLRSIEGNFSKYLERKLTLRSQSTRDDAVSALFSHLDVYPDSLREMTPLLVYVVDSENWSDNSHFKHRAIEWLRKEAEREVKEQRKWKSELEIKKKTIVNCPNVRCRYKIRIPETPRSLRVTCKKCNTLFECKMGVAGNILTRTQTAVAKGVVGRYERRVEQKRIEEERIKREEQLRREAEQRVAREKREQDIISEYGSLEAHELHQKKVASLRGYAYGFLGFVIFFGPALFLFIGLLSSC